MKSTTAHIVLLLALVDETKVTGWNNSSYTISGAQTHMHQALYSSVPKYQVKCELVIAEFSLIRSIFVVTAEVGRIHSMKLSGQADPDSQFLLSSIYL